MILGWNSFSFTLPNFFLSKNKANFSRSSNTRCNILFREYQRTSVWNNKMLNFPPSLLNKFLNSCICRSDLDEIHKFYYLSESFLQIRWKSFHCHFHITVYQKNCLFWSLKKSCFTPRFRTADQGQLWVWCERCNMNKDV